MKIVAEFAPTKWVVEKLNNLKQWDHVGDYDSVEKATARAKDLAQFYGKRSRILEMPK